MGEVRAQAVLQSGKALLFFFLKVCSSTNWPVLDFSGGWTKKVRPTSCLTLLFLGQISDLPFPAFSVKRFVVSRLTRPLSCLSSRRIPRSGELNWVFLLVYSITNIKPINFGNNLKWVLHYFFSVMFVQSYCFHVYEQSLSEEQLGSSKFVREWLRHRTLRYLLCNLWLTGKRGTLLRQVPA